MTPAEVKQMIHTIDTSVTAMRAEGVDGTMDTFDGFAGMIVRVFNSDLYEQVRHKIEAASSEMEKIEILAANVLRWLKNDMLWLAEAGAFR